MVACLLIQMNCLGKVDQALTFLGLNICRDGNGLA